MFAGTASSIAVSSAHRPSPESETRPVKLSRFGSRASAAAVRSSNHEVITLPRRQTSVMSARLKSNWYAVASPSGVVRSEEHTSELQSRLHLVCRLLLEKKKHKQS